MQEQIGRGSQPQTAEVEPWGAILNAARVLVDTQNSIGGPTQMRHDGVLDAASDQIAAVDVVRSALARVRRVLAVAGMWEVTNHETGQAARDILGDAQEHLDAAHHLLYDCERLVTQRRPNINPNEHTEDSAAARLVAGYAGFAAVAEGVSVHDLLQSLRPMTRHERGRAVALLRGVALAAHDVVGVVEAAGRTRRPVLRAYTTGVRAALHDCGTALADLVAVIDHTALVVCAECGTPKGSGGWVSQSWPKASMPIVEACGPDHLKQWAASHPRAAQRPALTGARTDRS